MVNCLTRCLWHWNKYGGKIVYDSNHAIVIDSSRVYHDEAPMDSACDIKEYGLSYFKNAHKDYLNPEELILLETYMKKNIFEVFKQINEDDAVNGTGNLAISSALVSANKVKAGGHVTMGVEEKTVLDIVLNQQDKIVLLLVVDRKTYNKFAE